MTNPLLQIVFEKHGWTPQNLWEEVKIIIEDAYTPWEPSTIEWMRMKEYCIPVLEQMGRETQTKIPTFRPSSEVVSRFISDYYGINLITNPWNRRTGFMFDCQEIGKYLNIKQKEFHLP